MASGDTLPDGFSFSDGASKLEEGRENRGAAGSGSGSGIAGDGRRASVEINLLAGLSACGGGVGRSGAITAAARCSAAWDLVTLLAGTTGVGLDICTSAIASVTAFVSPLLFLMGCLSKNLWRGAGADSGSSSSSSETSSDSASFRIAVEGRDGIR